MTTVQTSVGSWKLEDYPHHIEHDALTCDGCGRTYEKPIVARVSTPGHIQTYGACPHCMTKVYDINLPETGGKEKPSSLVQPNRPQEKASSEVKCDHFFGFLNKRTKGTPVPEHCLTCDKMVECLYG